MIEIFDKDRICSMSTKMLYTLMKFNRYENSFERIESNFSSKRKINDFLLLLLISS